MSTLRCADEIRPAQCGAKTKGEADPEMKSSDVIAYVLSLRDRP